MLLSLDLGSRLAIVVVEAVGPWEMCSLDIHLYMYLPKSYNPWIGYGPMDRLTCGHICGVFDIV